jgi:hypothetical protein
LDRSGPGAEECFRAIAKANDGVTFLLDPKTLSDHFSKIANQALLTASGNVRGAQLLLEHMQAVPFEMETNVVGAQVSKCSATKD